MSAEDLGREIAEEVHDYRRGHSLRGASIPVTLTGDGRAIEIDAKGLRHVCDGFLSGALTSWEVRYICDALSLADASFASERIRELLEEFADPALHDEDLSPDDVAKIRDELTNT